MEDGYSEKQDKIKEERPIGPGGIIGTVIFVLSFSIWILVAYGAYAGVPKGLFSVDNVYGFEALKEIFTVYSLIPVVPLCLLYQILFASLYIRKSKKILKSTALALTFSAVIFMLIPCLLFEHKKDVLLDECRPQITAHLTKRYGKEFAESVKIKIEDYDDRYFYLINPATERPASIHYYAGDPVELYDDVINYINNEEINKEFCKFEAAKLGLPDNVEIDTRMESADLTGFKAGDDPSVLFGSASFRIKKITINKDHCEANEVLPEFQKAWDELIPLIGDHYYNNSIRMAIRSGNKDFASAQIDYPANYNGFHPTVSIHTPYSRAYYLD